MNTIKRKCSCGKEMEFSAENRVVHCKHIVMRRGKPFQVTVTHVYIPNDGSRPGKPHKPGRGYLARLAQA